MRIYPVCFESWSQVCLAKWLRKGNKFGPQPEWGGEGGEMRTSGEGNWEGFLRQRLRVFRVIEITLSSSRLKLKKYVI